MLMRLSCAGLLLGLSVSCVAASHDHDATARPAAVASGMDSYAKLFAALTSGHAVTIVVDFSQCTAPGTNAAGPQVTGGFPIQGFIAPNRDFIAFSDVHETLDAQSERVTEYIRYRVTAQDKVDIRTARVQNGKVIGQLEYSCAMGSAARFYLRSH